MRIVDLVGKKFGKLTVLNRYNFGEKHIKWLCVCECGKEKSINGDALKRGLSKTCGCGAASGSRNGNYKHGSCKSYKASKEYKAWSNAKSRVFNENNKKYPIYGGRGISMSDEWATSFETFLADMGTCEKGLTLDRIDVNGNYDKGNCRWASAQQQAENRRNTIYMPSGKTFKYFCRELGLPYKSLHFRYKSGKISLIELESKYGI